jgi:predicted phage terminase large subunit-like protein
MPPRHGKSELCSVWLVVWFLALCPSARVGIVTYGHQFSAKWGRKIRAIIREHGHVLGLALDPEKDAANEFELLTGGSVLTTGIGGVLTGHGFDLVIVDDPHKNRQEAESQLMRANVIEWWQGSARNRLEPRGSVVTIMQRWREDDLVGFLLSEESGEEWSLINLPAVAEENDPIGRGAGEALWPERYDVDALMSIRTSIGSYNWASQYQQRPNPAGGSVFQRAHFRYWRYGDGFYELMQPGGEKPKRVPVESCMIFQTCDTALEDKSHNDWTVCSTWVVTPDRDVLWIDMARARLQVPDQLPFLFAQRDRYPRLAWQGVERKASGHGLIQEAKRKGRPFRVLEPGDRSKVLRATQVSILYENGQVYHKAGAEWLDAVESELLVFPNGAHDDIVDTAAYAGMEAGKAPVQIFI